MTYEFSSRIHEGNSGMYLYSGISWRKLFCGGHTSTVESPQNYFYTTALM